MLTSNRGLIHEESSVVSSPLGAKAALARNVFDLDAFAVITRTYFSRRHHERASPTSLQNSSTINQRLLATLRGVDTFRTRVTLKDLSIDDLHGFVPSKI